MATGFHRHYPDESNARVLQQRRQEILDDITDATGAVFLGLTFGCARCHDHKFDPILQADYYRLQAFFANTAADDHIPMLSRRGARRSTGGSAPSGKSRRAGIRAQDRRRCSNRTVKEAREGLLRQVSARDSGHDPEARGASGRRTRRRCGPRPGRIWKWAARMAPSR